MSSSPLPKTVPAEDKATIADALTRARADARWFAIGTIVFTPLALLASAAVLIVVIEWFRADLYYDVAYRHEYRWIPVAGATLPNLIVLGLVLFASKGAWLRTWSWIGLGLYLVLPALSYGTDLSTDSEFLFGGLWIVFAIASITASSQAYEPSVGEEHSVVALLPNTIIVAYRDVFRDLAKRRGPDVDPERAAAMVLAVARGDKRRQDRLAAAAAARGTDLRARLVAAKLLRRTKRGFVVGDAAPAALR